MNYILLNFLEIFFEFVQEVTFMQMISKVSFPLSPPASSRSLLKGAHMFMNQNFMSFPKVMKSMHAWHALCCCRSFLVVVQCGVLQVLWRLWVSARKILELFASFAYKKFHSAIWISKFEWPNTSSFKNDTWLFHFVNEFPVSSFHTINTEPNSLMAM